MTYSLFIYFLNLKIPKNHQSHPTHFKARKNKENKACKKAPLKLKNYCFSGFYISRKGAKPAKIAEPQLCALCAFARNSYAEIIKQTTEYQYI